jgi:hypothetical protein
MNAYKKILRLFTFVASFALIFSSGFLMTHTNNQESMVTNAVDNELHYATLNYTDDDLGTYNDLVLNKSKTVWENTSHSENGFDAFKTMSNSNVASIGTADYVYNHIVDYVIYSNNMANTLYVDSVVADSVGREGTVRDLNGDHTSSVYTKSGAIINQGWPYGYGGKDLVNGAIRVGTGATGTNNSFSENTNGIDIKFADNIYVTSLKIDFGPFFKADINLTYPNYTQDGCYSLDDYFASNTGLKIVNATSTAANRISESNGDLVPVTLADYSNDGTNDNRVTFNINDTSGVQIVSLRPSCTKTISGEFNHEYMARVIIRSIDITYYSIETNTNRGTIDFTNDGIETATENHNKAISSNLSLLKTYANTRDGDPTTNIGLVSDISMGNTKAYTEYDYPDSTGIDGQVNCVKAGNSDAKGTAPTGGIHIGTSATADNSSYITFTLTKSVSFVSIDFGPYIQTLAEYNDYLNSDVGIIVHAGNIGSYTETATAALSKNVNNRVPSFEDTVTSFAFETPTSVITIDVNSNTGGVTRRIMLRKIYCFYDTTVNNNVISFIKSLADYKTCTEYAECFETLIGTYSSLDQDALIIMDYYYIKDYSSTDYIEKDIAVLAKEKWSSIVGRNVTPFVQPVQGNGNVMRNITVPVLGCLLLVAVSSFVGYIIFNRKTRHNKE